ncbi:hypothetical protein K0M31_019832 [Melipona bicolor]|uniref:Uncharacterized protein n=1 Tax=Melipona bicolor TaxID=60889 RepID=A0AA40G308_9HYME|nr:hypothetical protein K0M31_019832 [Melipona bicolor]
MCTMHVCITRSWLHEAISSCWCSFGSPSIEPGLLALPGRRGAVGVDTQSRRARRDTPIEARNAEDGETGIAHRTVAQPGKHASRTAKPGMIHDYSPRNATESMIATGNV